MVVAQASCTRPRWRRASHWRSCPFQSLPTGSGCGTSATGTSSATATQRMKEEMTSTSCPRPCPDCTVNSPPTDIVEYFGVQVVRFYKSVELVNEHLSEGLGTASSGSRAPANWSYSRKNGGPSSVARITLRAKAQRLRDRASLGRGFTQPNWQMTNKSDLEPC